MSMDALARIVGELVIAGVAGVVALGIFLCSIALILWGCETIDTIKNRK